jgi:hypothetical protein
MTPKRPEPRWDDDAPRRRSSDRSKPWWHANAGWVTALALAGFNLWQAKSEKIQTVATTTELMPVRRDRELDQNFAWLQRQVDSLERRIAVTERTCRE